MKRFSHRIRDISQKAEQIRQAMEGAPEKAAQLRESVLLTAGQLQQLKSEVQASFAGVYVDSEDRLAQVVREINDSGSTFTQIGYELVGVELEFSPVQRVIVRLEKVEEVSLARIRSVYAGVQGRRTTQALLSSVLKAEEVAGKVTLNNLEYSGLVVHVGAAPSIRVCWSSSEEPQAEQTSSTVPPVLSAATAPLPPFAESGFFAPRSTPPGVVPVPAVSQTSDSPPVVLPAGTQPSPVVPAAREEVGPVSSARDLLEKFKTVPGFSKYRSMLRK